jgi:CBS domain-containing protein
MNTVRHILEVKGRDVWTIPPEATVLDALHLMADKDIGALLVVDGERLVGILSERDYARKVILMGKASKDTPVSEIMTSKLYTVHPDQTVEECMALMTNHRIRHLPVMDGLEIVGVISLGDVVNNIIYRQRQTIKGLEDRITSTGI